MSNPIDVTPTINPFNFKEQVQKMIDQFNQNMKEQGKPIEAQLEGDSIKLIYKDVINSLVNAIARTGFNVEVVMSETAIMLKLNVEDLKKLISTRGGIDYSLIKDAKFMPNSRGSYDFVSEIKISQ